VAAEVNMLRVFTDRDGKFGNPLGVVAAGAATSRDRQRIASEVGYGDTIFIEDLRPSSGPVRAEIFTPAIDVMFSGHAAVGAAWWLRRRGAPIRSLALGAGVVDVYYAGCLVIVEVLAQWTPDIALHELTSPQDVVDADPDDYSDGLSHYLWAWRDKPSGHIRSRVFAPEIGVDEDEATGAAAIRITEDLGRDLTIRQGTGSVIHAWRKPRGRVAIGGRVVHEGRTPIT
jgi:predicted PhzF superfamily epimerase YddE/YHI9